MKLVGQKFTIGTFDLAAAKNALNIVWQRQQEFKNVINMLGVFHFCRAYMYMCTLGKSVRFSGFEDFLIEFGICASESIEQVLSGKNYNRALRVHKCITNALEKLLLHAFEEAEHHLFDEETRAMFQQLAKAPSADMLAKLLTNDKCREPLSCLSHFKEGVHKGELGKTSQFWLLYLDMV